MCGIYGFARKENLLTALERHKLRGMIMDLAYQNEARGKDGTGIALLSNTHCTMFKEASPSSKLLRTKRFQKIIRAITDKTLLCLGHTRFATIGSIKNEHCHPFITEDFVGVHNGHFMNRDELLAKYRKMAKTPVDSEAIFRVIDGTKKTKAMTSKLSEMEGDFAIGFAKKGVPYQLYLIRNSMRPLHVAYVLDLKTLFWASDKEHLEYALTRNVLNAAVWEIKEDYLYVADVRNFNGRSNIKKIPCRMPGYEISEEAFISEDDFQPDYEPCVLSYKELDSFGYLQGTGINQYSKIPCGVCQKITEAGGLFYEEVSGKFLCEDCSFDFIGRFERRNKPYGGEMRDLFDPTIF